MGDLTFDILRQRLHEGSNSVEVSGFGRESTHKGYLTWMLNTYRWPEAEVALERLGGVAVWPTGVNTSTRVEPPFWIQFEKPLGASKVDLFVESAAKDRRLVLPIELKVDSAPGDQQFPKMSRALNGRAAIVLLLGTAAIRQDDRHLGGFGGFGRVTAEALLEAWTDLADSAPAPVQDWLNALGHEVYRLKNAWELTLDERRRYWDFGYRSEKHLNYALLDGVRKALRAANPELQHWSLYDGGYNAVLNLRAPGVSWVPVAADGQVLAFWEFNDLNLVLKVKQPKGTADAVEAWMKRYRAWVEGIRTSPPKEIPRRARAGSTWVSVLRWNLGFEKPEDVANAAAGIVEDFSPLLAVT